MPELTLELVSHGKSVNFTQAVVRIGRDPGCDLVLTGEEFPMVGRQHVVLRAEGDLWWVEDLQSTNGTFVNQKRIERQKLAPGDILRLGSDGPEIRIQFVARAYDQTTRPAALAAAAGVAVTQPPPTRPSVPAPTRPSPQAAGPSREGAMRPDQQPQATLRPSPSADASSLEQGKGLSGEDETMNEEKLSLLRNLLIVTLGLVLVLGGIVINQMQQISEIRKNVNQMGTVLAGMGVEVKGMHDEAKSAVGRFQPELDARLSKLENAMDGMDAKIQRAENDFIVRLKKELPGILDQAIETEMQKFRREAGMMPQGKTPH